ncbi:hypothetical protein CDD81_7167 [Ophiocordyceps australis]|uniref:Zn(2)-C6 fungal-type domain-containing protein n=1 Tax=Ophiocordyceps australis TaxID=1399860 RepID=A0A2C5Y670_9HYPO|nr:hypothetical protein CDD81_7167 [Ophiocordyceps australis]
MDPTAAADSTTSPRPRDSGNSTIPPMAPCSRAPLACLACRSRHLKCDGSKPRCSRCSESARQCQYAKSRRGGLDRAYLAHRRRRLAATVEGHVTPPQDTAGAHLEHVSEAATRCTVTPGPAGNNSTTTSSISDSPSSSPGAFNLLGGVQESIDKDPLIEVYYRTFHKFHPMVVPLRALARLCRDPLRQASLKPLLAVMRLIGTLYTAKHWPAQANQAIETCLAQAPLRDPFVVQCQLLYSVALFWYNDRIGAAKHKAAAHQTALDLGMHEREFAAHNAHGDAVLAESWRRTWWCNYIFEAYYLGTLGTLEFAVLQTEASVHLPCSEDEYESGEIPDPRTLDDYENREFQHDDDDDALPFSSFAHLIGAVKCAASAVALVPKLLSGEASAQILQAADATLDGWLLLLPDAPNAIVSSKGEIDELMHQAFLLVNVCAIGLHRPLSDLKFNQVEGVSSCAREPPREILTPDLVKVHTLRVLRAVQIQIRILALPFRPFHHTPFTTCMVSEGTLALLSACKWQLQGQELRVARDQIRMTIGCLKALGAVWPRTANNVKEIQTISQHVLGLRGVNSSQGNKTPESNKVPSLAGGNSSRTSISSKEEQSSGVGGWDLMASLGEIDLCGFVSIGEQTVNAGDLDAGLSWWINEPPW